MIVISGVLLLIAVVFLVIGLFGPLAWVYASIAVSVLSFVFLLVGVRQRRDVPAAAAALTPAAPRGGAAAAEADEADVTLVPASGRRTAEVAAGGAVAGAAAAVALENDDDEPATQAEPQQVRIHGSFGLSELVGHTRGIEGGDVTQGPRRALHQGQGQHGARALAEPQPQVYQRA